MLVQNKNIVRCSTPYLTLYFSYLFVVDSKGLFQFFLQFLFIFFGKKLSGNLAETLETKLFALTLSLGRKFLHYLIQSIFLGTTIRWTMKTHCWAITKSLAQYVFICLTHLGIFWNLSCTCIGFPIILKMTCIWAGFIIPVPSVSKPSNPVFKASICSISRPVLAWKY